MTTIQGQQIYDPRRHAEMKPLAIDLSGLRPSGLGAEFAHDEIVDCLLAGLNHGLAHLGIRAERPAASCARDDLVIVGRAVYRPHDGLPAVVAFEGDLVGH